MFSDRFSWRVAAGLATLTWGLFGVCERGAASGEEPGGLKFNRRCLLVSPNEGCAIGDVNRDGKPDIVAGTSWFAGPD